MTEKEYVYCSDCMYERGIGFDAWCDLGLKHSLNETLQCNSFIKRQLNKRYNDKYTDIEVNEPGKIILWKGNNGQRFTRSEFLKFLNENIK